MVSVTSACSSLWFILCHACEETYLACKYLQLICTSKYSAHLKDKTIYWLSGYLVPAKMFLFYFCCLVRLNYMQKMSQ